jgi:hypothetical protein
MRGGSGPAIHPDFDPSLGTLLGTSREDGRDSESPTSPESVVGTHLLPMSRVGLEPTTYGLKVRCSTS